MSKDTIVSLTDNDKSVSLDITKKAEFQPSFKMKQYLQTAIQQMSDRPSVIQANCDVSRRSWYRWVEMPGFEDWFYSEYKKQRRKILPKLDSLGMKYARKGDFKFWEAMNKKIGELIDDKTAPINVQVNNTIQAQRQLYELD